MPNVLSSSAAVGSNADISDNFDFIFAEPVSAAGLFIGNISPGTTTVQFLDNVGVVIEQETFDNTHAGIIGTGFDNRIFYGIIGASLIERIRTVEPGGDSDGVVYDSIQFPAVPEPTSIVVVFGLCCLTLLSRASCPRTK
ncbi:MAG: hypothetical protein WD669_11480 [Pirellulales bacterium]